MMTTLPNVLLTGAVPLPEGRSFTQRFSVLSMSDLSEKSASRIRAVAAFGAGRVDRTLIARLPALEIIANFGVGVERVDLDAARARGIVVTNTPGVLTDEVADLAIGLMLATVRRIPQAERFLRQGQWLSGRFPLSSSLRGRKVGIVGFGRIGQAIARRLAGFEVDVGYHSRTQRTDWGLPFFTVAADLAAWADVLILCTPGGASTDRMIDAKVLHALGPNGILVNVARGSLVDQAALTKALQTGTILAAGLDVFEREPCLPEALVTLENVVMTPHIGSSSKRTWAAMGDLMLANLEAWFDGRGALTPFED